MEKLKYIVEDSILAELLGVQNFSNKESAILELVKCQTAHYGRCEPHFDFGRNTSLIVPHRYLTQIISGITADCRSLV